MIWQFGTIRHDLAIWPGLARSGDLAGFGMIWRFDRILHDLAIWQDSA